MSENLLARWVSGDITPDELEQLKKSYDLEELSKVLELQERYIPLTTAPEVMYEDFKKRISSKKKKKPLRSKGLLSLGVLILLISIFYFILLPNNTNNTIINTTAGQRDTILFADRTTVILGPESQLIYNESAFLTQRIFELKGEAYFDVPTPGPLIVNVPFGKVEVLGTQFTINNRSKRSFIECYEGKVQISHRNTKRSRIIKAGEAVNITAQMSPTSSINYDQPEWMDGYKTYSNISILEVMKDLERYFDITFEVNVNGVNNKFNGRLPINDQGAAISYLKGVTGWSITQIDDKFVISE